MRIVITCTLVCGLATLVACDKIGLSNPFAVKSAPDAKDEQAAAGSTKTAARGFARTDLDSLATAVRDGDYAKLFGLLSVEYQRKQEVEVERLKTALASPDSAVRAKAEAELAELKIAPAEFRALDTKTAAQKLAFAKASLADWPTAIREMKAIKADSAKAAVTYVDTRGKEGTLHFTKEDGEWRLVP